MVVVYTTPNTLGGDIAGTGIGGRPRDAAKGIGETVNTELVDATRSAERKPLVDGNDEVGIATCGRGIRRQLVHGAGGGGPEVVHGTGHVERGVAVEIDTRHSRRDFGKHDIEEAKIVLIVGIDGIVEREIKNTRKRVASTSLFAGAIVPIEHEGLRTLANIIGLDGWRSAVVGLSAGTGPYKTHARVRKSTGKSRTSKRGRVDHIDIGRRRHLDYLIYGLRKKIYFFFS